MPNIRRKNGKFQARLTVKGKSLTATFPTREAADAWCLATRQELQLGKHADVQRAHQHTFCQLLDRYAEKVTPKKRGQHQELQRIRMLRSHPIAQRIAGELTSMDFADLRDELSVGRKPNTVRLYLSVCQQVCACPSQASTAEPPGSSRRPRLRALPSSLLRGQFPLETT